MSGEQTDPQAPAPATQGEINPALKPGAVAREFWGESRPGVSEALVGEARIIQEARMPTSALTSEQLADTRVRVKSYMESEGVTAAQIARSIDRSSGVVSQWLAGTYNGDNEKVARMCLRFIEQHARGEKSGMPQGTVSTLVVERMLGYLMAAQKTKTIAVIVGPAGNSKTTVCRACEDSLIVGSVHVECTLGASTPRQFAGLWARRLGLNDRGSLAEVQDRIIAKLKDSRGTRLQIIDEAHYLTLPSLNVVRDIKKQADVGVALVGYPELLQMVDAKLFQGQLASLISYRLSLTEEQELGGRPMYTTEEIVKFASSMGLRLTGQAAERLTELCCTPYWGGLRSACMLMLNAKLLAQRDGSKQIELKHLMEAYSDAQGRTHAGRVEGFRSQLVRKVKIA